MTAPLPRYICIHAHFYQPPRENPWLEEIETEESAYPFHDWNERITEECYTRNTQARILDEKGRLRRVVNCYRHISFDFGPTLLAWLEKKAISTYEAILEADAVSQDARSGHGNAIAHAYNHMIMPLASSRDKATQVIWGIEDFRRRFHRDPEGMWLPETAVDRETLDIMVQNGIRFTILAPGQARRVRESPRSPWFSSNPGAIDPSRPYLCRLSHGRSIVLFFYDGPISQAVAFEGLLNSGEAFRHRLLAGFSHQRTWPQLVNIATDGESYGHHHRFGEMALAFALEKFQSDPALRITNYGEYLENHPVTAEVEFIENSSWSCVHGVGRWSQDCGCSISHRGEWNQKWRAPLRAAMDLVRDRVDKIFSERSLSLLADPWGARDAYIRVILDNHTNIPGFLRVYAAKPLSEAEQVELLNLLEMQRNRMLMYTSCGWFFDDISGIEALQIMRYAARAIQLALPFDSKLLDDFQGRLASAISNVKPQMHGDEIFRQRIIPQIADLAQVAAHVAIDAGFRDVAIEKRLYCYDIKVIDFARERSGQRILLFGHIEVTSRITTETKEFMLALIYLGEVDLRCSVTNVPDEGNYEKIKRNLIGTFYRHSSTQLIRKLDLYFPGLYFSMKDLFAEQRIQIIEAATKAMYEEQASLFEAFYKKSRHLARVIASHQARIPDTFLASARFVLNRTLLGELEKIANGFFPDGLESVLEEARFWKIDLDISAAEKLIRGRILSLVRQLEQNPQDQYTATEIIKFLDLGRNLEITFQLGEAQIVFLQIARQLEDDPGESLPPMFPELADRLAVKLNH